MFTHQIQSSSRIFQVVFSDYARKHFLKRFQKEYKGVQWQMTELAIMDDLSHIAHGDYDLQRTQQVDELWHGGDVWVFKYDFRMAGTKVSAKASGNRLLAVLDVLSNKIEVIMIYSKADLPKKIAETRYLKQVLNGVKPEVGWR